MIVLINKIMVRINKSVMCQSLGRLNNNSFTCSYSYIRTIVNLSYKVIDSVLATPDDVPLLILHDLLSSKKQWDSIGKTIHNVTKRAVITIDLRNHGKSPHTRSNTYEEMTADVQKLLNRLSISRAFFLGHGMGGKTTMCTALLAPKTVAGMMIVDISPSTSSKQFHDLYANVLTLMKKITFKREATLDSAKIEASKVLKNAMLDDVTTNIILSNIILKSNNAVGWACNLDVLTKYFHFIASFPKSLKVKKYYGMALFIGGQLSECLPPDDLPTIRDLFPEAVITYVRSTGHNLQFDDTRSFLEIVIPLLK